MKGSRLIGKSEDLCLVKVASYVNCIHGQLVTLLCGLVYLLFDDSDHFNCDLN